MPFFVLTHHIPPDAARYGSAFTYVTDGIESALQKAKAAAGDKNVSIAGAQTVGQYLRAGLLDEIQLHLVPVLLGEGVRLFDQIGKSPIELEVTRVISSQGVTHFKYRLVK